jgi:hypothetical protein
MTRRYFLSLALILLFLDVDVAAQRLTVEGGAGFMPTNFTSSWGVSLQIPIYDKFSVYAAYTRLLSDDPRRLGEVEKLKTQYPIVSSLDPNFVFPRTAALGFYWGNQILTADIAYTLYNSNGISFDIGLGWAGIQAVDIYPVLRGSNLVYQEQFPALQYQGINLVGLLHYNLSKEFSFEGKCAFYGLVNSVTRVLSEKDGNVYPLTHGLFMLGVSVHPF